MDTISILKKLKGVKGGKGIFGAFCPIHHDYSLTVKETPEGITHISCTNGCQTHDIIEKLDIGVRSIYPPQYFFQDPKPAYPRHVYDQILLDLIQEARERGEVISKKELATEREAFMRLRKAS